MEHQPKESIDFFLTDQLLSHKLARKPFLRQPVVSAFMFIPLRLALFRAQLHVTARGKLPRKTQLLQRQREHVCKFDEDL